VYAECYSHREGDGGPDRNSNDGFFDLDRVTLADSKLEQFPLPKDCVSPRLVDFEGILLVCSWRRPHLPRPGHGVDRLAVTLGTPIAGQGMGEEMSQRTIGRQSR
jgi:hypothetical protein